MSGDTLGAPEPLNAEHDLVPFDSGEPMLDDWLRKRALAGDQSGVARTYVVASGRRVVGFYCLASGAVEREAATGRIRRNMPNPIPVMVIGRLAVDRAWQGRGLGQALLRDAVLRTVQAAAIGAIRAVLLHAMSEEARRFYVHCGFSESPLDPLTLMISVAEAERTLSGR